MLHSLLQRPGVRYLLVGGTVYVLELAIIVVAGRAGMQPTVAVVLSFIIGTAVSFLLQKLFTFGDKRMHHHIVIPQVVATTLLIMWNLAFTVLLTRLLQHHLPTIVIRTLALLITTVWNFYLYRTRIFKDATLRIDG